VRYTEWIGWASSALLLLTLLRQVYTQWRTGSDAGVSKWLFIGQVAASVGFTIYSLLLHNLVYVCSNVAILTTAVAGELVYVRNKRLKTSTPGSCAPAEMSTKDASV
jgi:MtN3 and saliva related transmembrane protein